MKFGSKIAVGVLSCVLLVALALAFAACGSSSSGPTTTTLQSTTSTPAATTTTLSAKQTAEAYFAAMAPTVAKDNAAGAWSDQAFAQWEQKYQATMATSRKAWTAFDTLIEQLAVKGQDIQKGYESITPPPAFKAAHEALIKAGNDALVQIKTFSAAVKAKRPMSELVSMLESFASGSPEADILAKFKAAAATVGVTLPADLVKDLTDDTTSSTTQS